MVKSMNPKTSRTRGWTRAKSNATDLLWAKIVKARDGYKCQRCGRTKPYQLHAAHIVGRRYKAVRWDLAAGVCICALCHFKQHAGEWHMETWAREQMGDRTVDRLLLLAKGPAKKAPDEKLVRMALREELRRVEASVVLAIGQR